jgi:HK97 family phage portal protein
MFEFLNRKASKNEARDSIENPDTPISHSNLMEAMGWDWGKSASGVPVTTETALGLPAVWCAVHFLSTTMASLPLQVGRRQADGTMSPSTRPIARLLSGAVNDELTSHDWRKFSFINYFTEGRQLTFIERAPSGVVLNLWPMDLSRTTIQRNMGRTTYKYKQDNGREDVYAASEVIDSAFSVRQDGISARSPIQMCKDSIGLGLAIQRYASNFFQNGGVPPFVLIGPFTTKTGLRRSSEDLSTAVMEAARNNRQALSLPAGHDLKPLGKGPEDMQLVEAQRFVIEQIARIYQLPPVFLQDLTHGTFSNVEQQDLQLVKHTILHLANQHEQQMNLKVFGRENIRDSVKYDLDGLQRGDFKTRIEASARAVQTGIFTPNEARERENLPPSEGGDKLFVQGAMLPITDVGSANPDAEQELELQDEQ